MEDLTEKCKISNTVKFGQVFSVPGLRDPYLGTSPLGKVEVDGRGILMPSKGRLSTQTLNCCMLSEVVIC